MSIEAIVNEFSAVAANPKAQLKAYKDAGKKCIGVMPYYAPEELVYAAGMMPFGMWGSNNKTEQRSKEYCATFYCTIAQLDLEMLLDGTMAVSYTHLRSMRTTPPRSRRWSRRSMRSARPRLKPAAAPSP